MESVATFTRSVHLFAEQCLRDMAGTAQALATWHDQAQVPVDPEGLRRDGGADIDQWDGVSKSKAIELVARLNAINTCHQDINVATARTSVSGEMRSTIAFALWTLS